MPLATRIKMVIYADGRVTLESEDGQYVGRVVDYNIDTHEDGRGNKLVTHWWVKLDDGRTFTSDSLA